MIHFLKFLFSKAFIINLLIAVVLLGTGLFFTLNYLDDYLSRKLDLGKFKLRDTCEIETRSNRVWSNVFEYLINYIFLSRNKQEKNKI